MLPPCTGGRVQCFGLALHAACSTLRTLSVTDSTHPSNEAFWGIAFVCAAIGIMSGQDAILKWLTGGYATVQILFLRGSVVTLIALMTAIREAPAHVFTTARPVAHLVRGALNFAAIFLFVLAVAELPLAQAMAIAMAAPLFTLAASALLLREVVGWRRWAACIVGFVGVLIMLRPTSDAFDVAGLYALGAALAYALFIIQTRQLTTTERTGTTLLYSSMFVFIASGAATPWVWQSVRLEDLALMVAAGLLVAIGHFCFIQAFRYASPATLAPFEFTALVWGTLLGWLIWNELPDTYTLAGATLVVSAGLYVIYREATLARRQQGA